MCGTSIPGWRPTLTMTLETIYVEMSFLNLEYFTSAWFTTSITANG